MPELEPDAPAIGGIPRLAEHLFRHEAGKLISVLTGIFGTARLQLAEDVVQEALGRALQTWPYYGIPKNPAAWLTQTAKNLALDLIRREKLFHDKQAAIITTIEQRLAQDDSEDAPRFEEEIKDGRLRLIFTCCHPQLPAEAQIALALKTLCGFSPAEIGRAFLTSEAAIAKRLTRARQRIQELALPFEIPTGSELAIRLEGVLQTLYLLFNEGYKASSGDQLIRADLCSEAIRLASLLAEHPLAGHPRTHALLALMLLNAARLKGRTDAEGNILRLEEQDRATWDGNLIALGIHHLGQASTGEELTVYHLQAGIAACHCIAPNYDSTDWGRILSLYDQLARLDASPVIALNRAVALANVEGPEAGIAAVAAIRDASTLESYYLLYAVLGEFEARRESFSAAVDHLQKAIELSELETERTFLARRLQSYQQRHRESRAGTN